MSRISLAIGYRDSGRIEDAIRLDEQTLDAREHSGARAPRHPGEPQQPAISYRTGGRNDDAVKLES